MANTKITEIEFRTPYTAHHKPRVIVRENNETNIYSVDVYGDVECMHVNSNEEYVTFKIDTILEVLNKAYELYKQNESNLMYLRIQNAIRIDTLKRNNEDIPNNMIALKQVLETLNVEAYKFFGINNLLKAKLEENPQLSVKSQAEENIDICLFRQRFTVWSHKYNVLIHKAKMIEQTEEDQNQKDQNQKELKRFIDLYTWAIADMERTKLELLLETGEISEI